MYCHLVQGQDMRPGIDLEQGLLKVQLSCDELQLGLCWHLVHGLFFIHMLY